MLPEQSSNPPLGAVGGELTLSKDAVLSRHVRPADLQAVRFEPNPVIGGLALRPTYRNALSARASLALGQNRRGQGPPPRDAGGGPDQDRGREQDA